MWGLLHYTNTKKNKSFYNVWYMEDDETRRGITKIINQNKIDDLRRFIAKRGCLNMSNQYLNYLFYLLQSIGVFSTSLRTAYQNEYLVWSGERDDIEASGVVKNKDKRWAACRVQIRASRWW